MRHSRAFGGFSVDLRVGLSTMRWFWLTTGSARIVGKSTMDSSPVVTISILEIYYEEKDFQCFLLWLT